MPESQFYLLSFPPRLKSKFLVELSQASAHDLAVHLTQQLHSHTFQYAHICFYKQTFQYLQLKFDIDTSEQKTMWYSALPQYM